MRWIHVATLASLLLAVAGPRLGAEDRKSKVIDDREEFLDNPHWVYNDLAQGLERARKARKPVLVVIRCIP